ALRRPGRRPAPNALALHPSAIAARPAVVYWPPATLAVFEKVRGLRGCGLAAWATMDAGPHVKVLTTIDDASTLAMQLRDLDGVTAVTVSAPGAGAHVPGAPTGDPGS